MISDPERVTEFVWHPFGVRISTPSFSGGLRFAATPGYFLATLRPDKVGTTLRFAYWAHTYRREPSF